MSLIEQLNALDASPPPVLPVIDPYPPPCIHGDGTNLCPSCQADFDGDYSAYVEYGQHPAGIANWKRLLEEIAEDATRPDRVLPDDDLPW